MQFNLADLWERVTDTVPDHEAMVCGTRRLTYAQVDERATRLAHAWQAAGIGPGDHVALYLYNGVEYLEAMIAAFKARAVPINVNYRYVESELRYLLDDADVFVAHRDRPGGVFGAAVRPQVRPADAGGGDADDRVGGFDDGRLLAVLDANVAGAVHDVTTHGGCSFS